MFPKLSTYVSKLITDIVFLDSLLIKMITDSSISQYCQGYRTGVQEASALPVTHCVTLGRSLKASVGTLKIEAFVTCDLGTMLGAGDTKIARTETLSWNRVYRDH